VKTHCITALVLFGCGCGPETKAPVHNRGTTIPVAEQHHEPFVRFSVSEMFIRSFDAVPIPTVTGSSPSPWTLVSDAADVASISSDGDLLPHKNGRLTVRTRDGYSLEVEVHVAARMVLSESQLQMPTQETRPIGVTDDLGLPIDPRALSWTSSNPSIATIQDGKVASGMRAGLVKIELRYGRAAQALAVTVTPAKGALGLFERPRQNAFALGSVREVGSGAQGAAEQWTTSNPEVLKHLGHGFFWARAVGTAKLCNKGHPSPTCMNAEVTK
jgi:hypothetical protein